MWAAHGSTPPSPTPYWYQGGRWGHGGGSRVVGGEAALVECMLVARIEMVVIRLRVEVVLHVRMLCAVVQRVACRHHLDECALCLEFVFGLCLACTGVCALCMACVLLDVRVWMNQVWTQNQVCMTVVVRR